MSSTQFYFFTYLKQGSLSSEAELSQYFSQDMSNHSFMSDSMLMSMNNDNGVHQQSCRTSMDDNTTRAHGIFVIDDLFLVQNSFTLHCTSLHSMQFKEFATVMPK